LSNSSLLTTPQAAHTPSDVCTTPPAAPPPTSKTGQNGKGVNGKGVGFSSGGKGTIDTRDPISLTYAMDGGHAAVQMAAEG